MVSLREPIAVQKRRQLRENFGHLLYIVLCIYSEDQFFPDLYFVQVNSFSPQKGMKPRYTP